VCGRIASNISGADQLIAQFLLDSLNFNITPRYNIAPSQDVLTVVQNGVGLREAVMLRWGLIPSWAKEAGIGNKMINARCETVAEKVGFRYALRERRCIIPATGFYEWQRAGSGKTPYHFRLRSGALMGLAGLWEEWHGPDGNVIRSFTIITTSANSLVAPMHNRMPVLLSLEQRELWLDHSQFDLPLITSLMQPYSTDEMEAYPVSSYVNSPRNEGPECIERVAV
jgi:putative SOS response-associated peptidase YedK